MEKYCNDASPKGPKGPNGRAELQYFSQLHESYYSIRYIIFFLKYMLFGKEKLYCVYIIG